MAKAALAGVDAYPNANRASELKKVAEILGNPSESGATHISK